MNHDFYNILELDRTKEISKEEIKRNYNRLVKKYHPDKNPDIDTTEKFKLIQVAYETLIDDNKREYYNKLDNKEKIKFYDEVITIINNKYPNFKEYVNYFIETFYDNSEDETMSF